MNFKHVLIFSLMISLFISCLYPVPSVYGEETGSAADVAPAEANIRKEPQVILAEDLTAVYGYEDFDIGAVLLEGMGELSYASSDNTIATIDQTGRIHITGVGTVILTITAAETEYFLETVQTITLTVVSDDLAPRVKYSRPAGTALKLSWNKNTTVTGYQVQYSSNSLFTSRTTKTVTDPNATSLTIKGLSKGKTYYGRVRSYTVKNGKTFYSPWGLTSNAKKTKTAKLAIVQKKRKTFELRSQTKQKLYRYDTLQGSCTDGTYGYYVLYNRNVEKCKIAKIRLSDMKVVKVSKVLRIDHGSDLTYNSRNKYLVAANLSQNPRRLTVINRNTLRIKRFVNVKIPSTLKGATKSQLRNLGGFKGISYNASRNQYVILPRKSRDFLILNNNFKPVSYITASKKTSYLYQSIDTTNDYILVAQSPQKSGQIYNIISVYDWDGTYRSRINVKKGYEIESVYHIGSKLYAGFYRSYYTRVKGKKKLMRSNYIYRLTEF